MNQNTMERYQRILESSYFPVTKVRDDNRLGFALVDDNGRKLAEVSERYELVNNKRLIQPIVDRLGIDKLVSYRRQGNNFYYLFDTGKEIDFGGNGESDILKHRILIRNSYDKTRSYNFINGAFRQVCSNGLVTLQCGFRYKKKHVGEIPVEDHVQKILASLDGVDFSFWRQLKEVKLDQSDKTILIGMFNAFDTQKEYSRSDELNRRIQYNAQYQNEREVNTNSQLNAWGLLNNINWGISRSIGNSNTQAVISANLKLEEYLKQVVLN